MIPFLRVAVPCLRKAFRRLVPVRVSHLGRKELRCLDWSRCARITSSGPGEFKEERSDGSVVGLKGCGAVWSVFSFSSGVPCMTVNLALGPQATYYAFTLYEQTVVLASVAMQTVNRRKGLGFHFEIDQSRMLRCNTPTSLEQLTYSTSPINHKKLRPDLQSKQLWRLVLRKWTGPPFQTNKRTWQTL